MKDTVTGSDGRLRCSWSQSAPEFPHYHDTEWGFPVTDDIRLFEKICLESFQSGLSWRTILVKRESFRHAFNQFDFNQVSNFTTQDVERLLQNRSIVRNKRKIVAVINNAKRAIEMVEQEGSLATFLWQFKPVTANLEAPQSQTTSLESTALAKALKQRGWQFVGPSTAYAFMQAMGLINDHVEGCYLREIIEKGNRA